MQQSDETFDILLVGGGVIGLSLAWELAQQGIQVCVTDSRELGHEASWAAAGMLPPGPLEARWPQCSSFDQLAGLSELLHHEWHDKLSDLTGIDTGYRRTGALYLSNQSPAFEDSLGDKCETWEDWGVDFHRIDLPALSDLEPQLTCSNEGVFLPGEAQLRTPRYLKALEAACLQSGVKLLPHCQVLRFERSENRLEAALTCNGRISADQYCLTAGCWTGQIAASLDLNLPMRPVRGQILLLEGPAGLLQRIVNVGHRYLLPRSDGSVLVGSTLEEVGFDHCTTTVAREELLNFAHNLCPALRDFQLKHHWSGLRPATPDELPYLGRLPNLENVWIAAGHFRAGIQLSTGTAVVMRSLILGQPPQVDTAEFKVGRGQGLS